MDRATDRWTDARTDSSCILQDIVFFGVAALLHNCVCGVGRDREPLTMMPLSDLVILHHGTVKLIHLRFRFPTAICSKSRYAGGSRSPRSPGFPPSHIPIDTSQTWCEPCLCSELSYSFGFPLRWWASSRVSPFQRLCDGMCKVFGVGSTRIKDQIVVLTVKNSNCSSTCIALLIQYL